MSIRLNGKIIAGNSKSTYTGFEIGDIGISSLGIDENQNRRRYLNGQIIISEQFVAFTEKLKSASTLHPTLICTEEEWQTISLMSVGGQCGKFVIDDEAGTIRLPRIIMPIQGLTDLSKLGEIVEAGLPNITGTIFSSRLRSATNEQKTGAFSNSGSITKANTANNDAADVNSYSIDFDASLSNPIYGNSNTVQQEQIQYPYFIQVATGSETEDNIINTLELNNPYSLFDSKYVEAPLYNVSWLRSNGQYNSSAIYLSAYQALLVENNAEVAIGSTVTLPIGTEYTKRGLSVKLSTDSDITDYDFRINTAEETFMLPTKVKLASGKAVVGNGLALGLTTGTTDFTLTPSNVSSMPYIRPSIGYGYNVGEESNIIAESSTPANYVTAGVTTDPTKSGIETSDANLHLYFYVGETVQNANLINAGRIEEKLNRLILNNKNLIIEYILADYSKGILVGEARNITVTYTAPADGYIVTDIGVSNGSNSYLKINGVDMFNHRASGQAYYVTGTGQFVVAEGDLIEAYSSYSNTVVPQSVYFYPMKGVN